MSENPERDSEMEMLKKAVQELSEHFDTVQLFASRHDNNVKGAEQGVTISLQTGCGHWYARYGQVLEWVIKKDEQVRVDERKDND